MSSRELENRSETMKVFSFLLIGLSVAAEEKKVPPRHPLQRLNTLISFSQELLDNWYGFLPSQAKWKNKFVTNGSRMERSFTRGEQRCGFFDDNSQHGGPARKRRADDDTLRYDTTDPRTGTKEITTGFRKWAERYISDCSGQKTHQYQINRMSKWNNILQAHLDRNEE